MLGKNKAKYIISLQKRKNREEEKLYVIEGDKMVREFINNGMPLVTLYAKPEFLSSIPAKSIAAISEVEAVNFEELRKISSLTTPHNALAVVRIPDARSVTSAPSDAISVALDLVQDPGNLGTIIRAAAWFGIRNIYCSEECVDVYNPKVIQASMGAVMHVTVQYTGLKKLFGAAREMGLPVFGAVTEGISIYTLEGPCDSGIILLGNESRGISDDLLPMLTNRIMIPKFTSAGYGIDSLNVSMAASIIFSEFARRKSGDS
jgi:RNA methyltransferase, TrmH family